MHRSAIEGWDALYRDDETVERLPWYTADLDPDLLAALERRQLRSGRLLDLGTGPGTQALHLAARGFEVTASDISPASVALVERLAAEQGLDITGVVDDVFASQLQGPFDLVLDRGCFHVLPPPRDRYVESLLRVLAPEGLLLLKVFSDREPGTHGPYRVSEAEIRSSFEPMLQIESLVHSVYQGTHRPLPRAIFAVLRRPATQRSQRTAM